MVFEFLFAFLLLAGRKEEKEEMQAIFEEDLHDDFSGIQVHSFEEFGENVHHRLLPDKVPAMRSPWWSNSMVRAGTDERIGLFNKYKV